MNRIGKKITRCDHLIKNANSFIQIVWFRQKTLHHLHTLLYVPSDFDTFLFIFGIKKDNTPMAVKVLEFLF